MEKIAVFESSSGRPVAAKGAQTSSEDWMVHIAAKSFGLFQKSTLNNHKAAKKVESFVHQRTVNFMEKSKGSHNGNRTVLQKEICGVT